MVIVHQHSPQMYADEFSFSIVQINLPGLYLLNTCGCEIKRWITSYFSI